MQLVNITEINKNIVIDLRYASKNNFTNQVLYKSNDCLLRQDVALALDKVQQDLEKNNMTLKIWDAYRPIEVQEILKSIINDPNFVSEFSNHSQGIAVDVTLSNQEMPTDFDEFNEKANPNYNNLPENKIKNRNLLKSAMEKHGFKQNEYEWWHFDYINNLN
ncbi:M15 family metallopeptidase [Candidatus Woesearchaeota archaeon]|nr:M15 family metallopeptidase [Candidatus Woesearchaeota archaeon]